MIFTCNFPEFLDGRRAFSLVYFFTFKFFVGLGQFIFFRDLHGSHNFIGIRITEGDFIAVADAVGIGLVHGKGHGDGPESSIGQLKIFTNTFPVGFGHKACQRAESADTHHDKVSNFSMGHGDFF